jgi:rhodanese-related sulfurtransferase
VAAPPFQIEPAELARLREAGEAPAILDVREGWELDIVRFATSIDVPLGELPARLGELPRDRLLVVVCHHGMRSAQATAWLRAEGLANATNLAGGIDAWAREIDQEMGTY